MAFLSLPAGAGRAEATSVSGCPFDETRLGPVPAVVSLLLTADRRHVAYAVPEGERKRVYFDGRVAGPDFDGVFVNDSFVRGADGERLAYAVVKEDKPCTTCGPQGKWRAVVDGQPGPVYDKISRIDFSPNGKHFAYGAVTRLEDLDAWNLIVDGRETPLPYEAISHQSPKYTRDGRLVYVAKKGEKTVVVVDGREGAEFDKVGTPIPVIGPGGTDIAYVARNYGEAERVILNGTAGPGFDEIPPASLIFSDAGGRFAYGGRKENGKWCAVLDGVEQSEYDQVDRLAFSADGKRFAYQAKKAGGWVLVVDGKEAIACEEFSKDAPLFSPDGTRLAQGARVDGRWRMLVWSGAGEDIETPGGDFPGGAGLPVFGRDGRALAFVASLGKKRVVVKEGGRGPEFDAVAQLTLSPDGTRIAYEAGRFYPDEPSRKDTWFPVLDGEALPEHDGLTRGTLVFSADSRHFAYAVAKGDKRSVIVNGEPGPDYRSICSLYPSGESGFEALVVGADLVRLNWSPVRGLAATSVAETRR